MNLIIINLKLLKNKRVLKIKKREDQKEEMVLFILVIFLIFNKANKSFRARSSNKE